MKTTGLLHGGVRCVRDLPFASHFISLCSASKWPPVRRLVVFAFSLVVVALPLRAQNTSHTGMVSFGDSLSDVGNLNSVLSSITENTAQYLTGWDPNYYYNYRFSNGPIWVDQLYTDLGFGNIGTMGANDGVNNINGTNFSWAESRSGTGYSNTFFPNLLSQIDLYSGQLGSNPSLPDPSTTLFTIWSGANDVFAHVEYGDPITPAQVADNIAMSITSLYEDGGRSFVVLNLPPIGQIPSYLNDPIKGDLATAFVDITNDLLDAELDALSDNLDGITIFKVDVHELFLSITTNPEAYGFTNTTDTAYIRYGQAPYDPRNPPYGELAPNSNGYFYWDAAHGTTATNALIAQAAYQVIVPEPSTLLYLLLAGLGALVLGRKSRSGTLSTIVHPR
jgi:phospholipase/lecithinase/hemolysin